MDLAIMTVLPRTIASVRDVIPNYAAVGRLFEELFSTLGPDVTGTPLALWHDHGFKAADVDAEAAIFLDAPVPVQGRVAIRELDGAKVGCVVHRGAYNRLSETYGAVMSWLQSSEYQLAGPIREIYHHMPAGSRADDESAVTEIQIPLDKK